ncbi:MULTISPECIES: PepSY-associated TM helix domain-containing protein [unclassified Pseudomonas]|uniref:PepSY-associated TM helix domain-containing protein n=1 Tax=unclassified Pseudomonas TaxID=196821 RepID=UPI000D349FEC|nr:MULTISPECIES: PepSY-associated TM helix domain-containing protein [unclassified Pseudomonas]RAU46866.1 PepSY domain-containing protein [Pseudomonas sp. RIT 409]RAU54482.1 PepSY domain-containing protein [Pseudomonas sp. RIT 412]
MKDGFRQAMAWLHTWVGLVFGWLLFAIFLTGTLSYFKNEITRWTQPEIVPHAVTTVDSIRLAQGWLQQNASDAKRWFIRLPDERTPELGVSWAKAKGGFEEKPLDSLTGTPVLARDSKGGEFFYRFHFQLQMPHPWGRWLASLAAMAMFVALISGIITHKKIFKEFFTFRPRKGQRTWLDGHNAVAVLVLPFHLMITYSSLVIFMTMIMPASILTTYGKDTQGFFDDLFPAFKTAPPAPERAPLAPIAPMLAVAADKWPGSRVGLITVNNPGSANASVTLTRHGADHIANEPGTALVFDGVSGDLKNQTTMSSASLVLAGGLYGLHMGHFAGPLLRWLYFLAGIGGTAMIGTGLVIWLGKRKLKHAKAGVMPFELRLVEALNVSGMAGLMLAVVSFFWANRLLPTGFAARSDWEVKVFFYVWAVALLHGFVRVFLRDGRTAWREQLTLGALLYCTLPVLDVLTAGDYLLASLKQGDMTQAALDATAAATGVFLAWGAFRFRRDSSAALEGRFTSQDVRRAPGLRHQPDGASANVREVN